VLHKFASAIGKETYSIVQNGVTYTLKSQFEFTDRGTKVPLETTFVARVSDMTPVSYVAKGKSARGSRMDDALALDGQRLSISRSGKTEAVTVDSNWFITDGYSPVSMQEQMMRWWIAHGRPARFIVYPAGTEVRIAPAGTLHVGGDAMQGYTVAGLIWGQEALWMDDAQNLTALVSTDAEFDHFEAVREPYQSSLGAFISAALQIELTALAGLTANAKAERTPVLAIMGATLEDSTGAPAVENSVILIKHGVIAAVGKSGQVVVPNDATLLDATGKYAVPGLWDMHAHYEQVEWGPIYLASGITSVRDVGNEFDFIRTIHNELNRSENPGVGPHIEFAGVIDGTGPITLGAITADTPEQAVQWVEKYQAAGARQIKLYSSVKPDIVKAITAAAHARGMTVTGHVPAKMSTIEAVNYGMNQINHLGFVTQRDGERAKQLIDVLREHHTIIDPTTAISEMGAHTEPLDQLEPGVDCLPPQLKDALDTPPAPAAKQPLIAAQRDLTREVLRRLHAAGITIVAGTDQAVPGYSLHREMEIYVEAGFTPLEALQSATLLAARAAGVEQESGSLELGKRGDVLLLDADPLKDIHNTRRVWRTVAAGVVYEPEPLWRSVGFLPPPATTSPQTHH
jgi:imidazolonepropionase-like amidohydrolase